MLNVDVMNERQVLVVTGNFEIVQQVQQALRGRGFKVHSAFSHRDASYAMRQGRHDVVLVDAAMSDRHSGDRTVTALSKQSLRPPLVALLMNGTGEEAASAADNVITSLDETIIQQAVMQALRIPALQPADMMPDEGLLGGAQSPERVEEIQTLFALGRSLTEVLNLSEVLNRIVEAARRLTNAEEGMILLPDGGSGQLWLRAKVGIDVEVARNFRVRTQDTLAGSVFQQGKPLLIGERGPQKVKTEYFVNALLYVPILLRGTPIGVLGVNNKNKHDAFDTRHQELLVNLASYAAVAIENARVHEESIKQARELKALVDASQVINSSVALERALPNVCEQFIQLLDVDRAEILEWDRAGKQLRTLGKCYRSMWKPGHEPVIQLDHRPALRSALETGQSFMVNRRDTSVLGEMELLDRVGAGAMLVLPVLANEQVLGAALVFYVNPPEHQPPPEAVQRASRVALQCLAQLVDSTQTNTQAVFRLAREMNAMLSADWCECALRTPDGHALLLRLAAGEALWLNAPYLMLDLTRYPEVQKALETQTTVTFKSDEDMVPEGERALLDATRARALLGVPLVNRGLVTGLALLVATESGNGFSAHDVDLASAIVGQAATALENARLVHDLELSLRELRETQGRLIQTARLSAMGELAAAVAHQVNNPLTTIVLDAELMLLNEPQDSPRIEALQAIGRAGKRAAGVVRRLLTAARPAEADAQLQEIDAVATIVEVVSLVKSHIERDKVRLTSKIPKDPLPPVMALPGQLDDVWLNLLLNAHDALQGTENAQLGIEVSHIPDGETMSVVVWDNGPGIPDHIVNDIFKPFFTTKPVGEGTGLGLHICRQVIERVGGSISVKSSPDKGTRFLVQLPVKRGED